MALGTVIRSFATPASGSNFGMAWDGRYLWLTRGAAIYKIDPVTGVLIDTLTAPSNGGVGLTWDGRALWYADNATDLIYQIDPISGVVIRSFSAPTASPSDLAWDGHALWVADRTAVPSIYQVDPISGTVIKSVPANTPRGLTWDGHTLWYTSAVTGLIYQLDPNSGVVIRSARAPGATPGGLTWDGRTLWLSDYAVDLIYQLSVSSEAEYAQKVLSYSPIAYWPMWEPSGAISADISGNLRHGAYTGVTLGEPGIGDGYTSPLFDGINDYSNIFTASLNTAFDPDQGTLMIWANVSGVGVWTDGTNRYMVFISADANNYIGLRKSTANNRLDWLYNAGGTLDLVIEVGHSETEFFNVALTWDVLAGGTGELKAYFAGLQVGLTQTGLGIWVGALSNTATVIGAVSTFATSPWSGSLAHCALFDTVLTPAQLADLAVL